VPVAAPIVDRYGAVPIFCFAAVPSLPALGVVVSRRVCAARG